MSGLSNLSTATAEENPTVLAFSAVEMFYSVIICHESCLIAQLTPSGLKKSQFPSLGLAGLMIPLIGTNNTETHNNTWALVYARIDCHVLSMHILPGGVALGASLL